MIHRSWLLPFVIIISLFAIGATDYVPATVHKLYVPEVVNGPSDDFKGIALSADWACGDMQAVGGAWFYTWSQTPPFCAGQTVAEWVPMAVTGQPSQCWPVVLMYNEPTVTPSAAAADVTTYKTACPFSLTVLGNVSQYSLSWMTQTLALLPTYSGAVGIHAYCWYTADDCLAVFAAAEMGHPVWITETAIFHAQAGEVARLLDGARACCAKVAWYTNRPTAGDPWADREHFLFDDAGALTPVGIAYQE